MQRFIEQLTKYRSDVDRVVAGYVAEQRAESDGVYADRVRDSFFDILTRGGKRIRGALVLCGYEMMGGREREVALQAALAVELMHAYILIIDDIQDRSDVRRGGATAHKDLEQVSKEAHWSGDHAHTGTALALNAALIGAHSAQNVLATLTIPENIKKEILVRMNQAMIMTAHGQTGDIVNELIPEVGEQDIERVLEQKTAHYTILNPLQIGMLLAGASQSDIDHVEEYAVAVGRAFQISDDLLLFESSRDKDPSSDIKEGKITLLTHYALTHADPEDARYLREQLGNRELSGDEFEQCKQILIASGAHQHVRELLNRDIQQALAATTQFPSQWGTDQVAFLRGIAEYLGERKQ